MFEIDPVSAFWSLQCQCEGNITMTGKKLLSAGRVIRCPNCGCEPDITNLQEAIKSLAAFQLHMKRATSPDAEYVNFQKIIPPGCEEPNLMVSCPLGGKLTVSTIKGD